MKITLNMPDSELGRFFEKIFWLPEFDENKEDPKKEAEMLKLAVKHQMARYGLPVEFGPIYGIETLRSLEGRICNFELENGNYCLSCALFEKNGGVVVRLGPLDKVNKELTPWDDGYMERIG